MFLLRPLPELYCYVTLLVNANSTFKDESMTTATPKSISKPALAACIDSIDADSNKSKTVEEPQGIYLESMQQNIVNEMHVWKVISFETFK